MIRDTSIRAYMDAKARGILSERRFQVVLSLFRRGSPSTCSEVYETLCDEMKRDQLPIPRKDSINPRFSELADAGIIQAVGERECGVTGRRNTIWQLTGYIPESCSPRKKKDSDCCSVCGQVFRTDRARAMHDERRPRGQMGLF